jgi:hypothetical protein
MPAAAEADEACEEEERPRWFTPARLLFIFCVINLVVYLERGALVACGVLESVGRRSTALAASLTSQPPACRLPLQAPYPAMESMGPPGHRSSPRARAFRWVCACVCVCVCVWGGGGGCCAATLLRSPRERVPGGS